MSGLGKILIVLNLLAAGGFMYFSMENWKIRQELTYTDFRNEVQIRGIPVAPPDSPGELDADRVVFIFGVNPNTSLDSLSKETLNKLIPKGDETYGGEAVADQTAEVKRLHAKVAALIAANPADKAKQLRIHTLNLTRTGAERDGVIAVFDMLDPAKASFARADLPYVARTSSQVAALKALVEIGGLGDPATITPADTQASRIKGARDNVALLIRGEISHGAGGSGADAEENARKLTNSVVDALKDGAGDAAKQNLAAAATGDAEGFKHLADLAVNPLKTKADVEAARASVQEFVLGKTITAAEKTALTEIVSLIAPAGPVTPESVEKAATALLDQKFEEAEAPAAAGKSATSIVANTPMGEKARRIAHVLYHIDAHRAFDATAKEARNQWHTRVTMIVGLTEYVRTAEVQATEYTEAANRLLAVITEEQSVFESEYQARVQRCLFLNSQLISLDAQLKQQVAVTAENERLYNERVTERDKLKEELDKAREDSKESLASLKKAQADLFKIQKELRDAQEALLRMEKELRQLELGR
ncbi:hypothetical protein [Zavarzinella formosa]|uniref:hypothetical protein n=1 Tax=Zavarzinella formosa TaxID=360055 RepID=UPI0002D5937D|nr:hypothetical protein [Zavarzinella formosa]